MKWKNVIILVVLAVLAFLAFVFYYGFGWEDLASLSFYINLANPSVSIVKVAPGLRKEEVADVVGDKLGWDDAQKSQFINSPLAIANTDSNGEGYFFPKSYLVLKSDSPQAVGQMMFSEFNKQVSKISKPKTTRIVNEDTAVKIASIIQRESGGKSDMRLISGIIWNRLFAGMKLQMDDTLQYAKGNPDDWWPAVTPADKSIDSPYNTYLYPALPPSPIDSPGIDAIAAAYNPQTKSCLYYLHDKQGRIHCSATYAGQLENIAKYY
jgi:UPF0755 protein